MKGCPLKKKKFLWIKYDGDHEWQYYSCNFRQLGMNSGNDWHLCRTCAACGQLEWLQLSHSEMIRRGFVDRDGKTTWNDDTQFTVADSPTKEEKDG